MKFPMKRTDYFLIFISAFFMFLSSKAWSQVYVPDVKTVVVWGEARVTNDLAADKRQAVSRARRNALEQVVGSYVTSESKMKNFQLVEDRIYSKSTGFINSYRILQENRNQVQRVQIEANVSLVPVTDILRDSGLLRKWRVGVVLSATNNAYILLQRYYSKVRLMEVLSNIESAVGSGVVQAGFTLVDPRHVARIRTHLQSSDQIPDEMMAGIDILVTGSVSLAARASSGNMHQAICQIHAKALRADTGEIIFQDNIGNTFDGVTLMVARDVAMKYAGSHGNGLLSDGTPDLRTFGMEESAAIDKAITLSSAMASDIIVAQIARIPAAGSAIIALEVSDVDFSDLTDIEAHLQTVEGVSSATLEEFNSDNQAISVEYDGDAMMLAKSLSKSNLIKKIGLKVKHVTKNKIILAK
jgi:hypothetical protein